MNIGCAATCWAIPLFCAVLGAHAEPTVVQPVRLAFGKLPVSCQLPEGVFATAATDAGNKEVALLVANTHKDAVALDLSSLDGWTPTEARVIDATRGYEKAAVPKALGGEAVWFVRYRR